MPQRKTINPLAAEPARPEGLQLVPARTRAGSEPAQDSDSHPLAPALILGGIASIGAVTFVGALVIWLAVRNTGVNWLFQVIQASWR